MPKWEYEAPYAPSDRLKTTRQRSNRVFTAAPPWLEHQLFEAMQSTIMPPFIAPPMYALQLRNTQFVAIWISHVDQLSHLRHPPRLSYEPPHGYRPQSKPSNVMLAMVTFLDEFLMSRKRPSPLNTTLSSQCPAVSPRRVKSRLLGTRSRWFVMTYVVPPFTYVSTSIASPVKS